MLENEPIECINDAMSGKCRPVRDAKAWEQIEEIKKTLGALENIEALQEQLTTIQTALNGLDNTYATDEDIQRLQSAIDLINDTLGLLNNTYATDQDITRLEGLITELQNSLNALDNTYATDQDIAGLQTQLTAIQTKVNELVEVLNELDNTYATDTDLSNLNSVLTAQITELQNTLNNLNIDEPEEEIVFNRHNSELNWGGYTDGLTAGTFNIDLTKYRELICYSNNYGIVHVQLEVPSDDSNYAGQNVYMAVNASSQLFTYIISCSVNSAKNTFTFNTSLVNSSGSQGYSPCKIVYIKGVL